jgi:hypothetical protein
MKWFRSNIRHGSRFALAAISAADSPKGALMSPSSRGARISLRSGRTACGLGASSAISIYRKCCPLMIQERWGVSISFSCE